MATSMLVIFLICFSHHVAWRYPFPLPFHWCRVICTFQSPGETLIATAANLCSVPFPGGLFFRLLSGTLDRIPRTSPSWMLFCHLWEKVKGATLLRTIFMVPHFYSIFPPSHHRFPSTCHGYTLQTGRNLWYTRQIDPCIIDSFLFILGHQQLYDFSSGH